jgi:hypothetical protein
LPTLESRSITTDLTLRSRALWCLVRCTVTALWRSRLASLSSATMAATTGPLITTTLRLVFCDGTILRLGQDEIVNSLAEQHQAAPCEYQILAAIEKQLKEQQQRRQANPKVNAKSKATTTNAFWKEIASGILATIQGDVVVEDDGESNGSFHVLDLTSSRPAAIPNSKQAVPTIEADEERTTMDLTQHIYSTNAVQANADLKNSGKDVESKVTIAMISIGDDDDIQSASTSSPTGNGHQQQQHEHSNMIAKMMRNGFVQACRHVRIPVYASRTFLTTNLTWASTTISSSISLPPASATGASSDNDCYYACQDRQAATITLLQHFLYQNRRLVPDYCLEASPARACMANSEKDNEVNNGNETRRFLTTTTTTITTTASDHGGDNSPLLKAKTLTKKNTKKSKH